MQIYTHIYVYMEAHEQALLLEMIPIFPPMRVEQVTALYIYIYISLVDLAGSLLEQAKDPDSETSLALRELFHQWGAP